MFRFKADQKIYEIAGVKVGGQPGEVPTMLVGSMFYQRHKIVSDEKAGIFDKDAAEGLVKKQEELGDITKNAPVVDIIGSNPNAIIKYVDFIADLNDKPFFVDSASADVKIAAIKHAKEVGLEKRVIYNSVSIETKENELTALKECDIDAGILLTYTKDLMRSSAREKKVEELMPKMLDAGVDKILVDTFVMDVPCLTPSSKATIEIKNHKGLPCGTAAHNAVSTWKGLKGMLGKEGVKAADLTANLLPVTAGADYVLYGPIENCGNVFPAVFTIDSSYKYAYRMKESLSLDI
ncbi:tetrahydromethanopterin S-methyltransferase subunit H [Methanomicrobium sp. W14]|jgi:tetrahydromethanopterin S-methyltransferase subunit H|uniref:tetrahydromethanopterin S-methyltransferase subunit H family protein n=1 Tax=Methanomicrobium sp. W14 TaxID=2817839 RepID=UPI001AE45C3A|nr:tetrahydromethanopterin S-methyltransferase subunit H [Methanomicrobium sp. W14]MBP2134234.1 tetrahydromethanopterin S-methyltransferase subunit H [Methanomicrobium sp. W14]